MKKLLLLALISVGVLFATAQGPQQINYQGVARNSVGSIIANQNINLRLSVRNGSANGPVIYSESRNLKTNSYGLFVTAIGSSGAANVTGVFGSINWSNGIKFLQVEIDPTGSNNYIDMGTAQLLSVPYALYANAAPPVGNAGGDLIGSYPSPLIRDGAITNSKIGDGEISASKLQPGVIPSSLQPTGNAGGDLSGTYPNPTILIGAVDNTKLADNSVGTTKIQDASVTSTKLAPGVIPTTLPPTGSAGGDLTGTYPNPTIGLNAVTTTKIADGSVTSSKLAPGVLPTTLPPSGTAGGDLTGSYPNPTITSNAVTTTKIADNSIITSKVADGSITSSKLAAGVLPTSLPPSGTAGGDLTGTYPNPTLNTGVVDNTKLADNSVSTIKVQDASITSVKLAAGVIPTSLPPNGSAGGDLTGTYPNPSLNKIKGIALSSTAPTTGQVLKYDGTQWIPSADNVGSGGSPTGSAGGDLTGTYPNPTLNTGVVDNTKLADNAVSTVKIQDGSVTSLKIAPGVIPTSLPPSGIAGGDLSSSYPNPVVSKIRGITVANVAPTTGQVLSFDGTQWTPSTVSGGGGGSLTLPYSSTTGSSSSLFSLTNSGSGSALTGTNSTTGSNVSGVIGTISSTTPGAMSAGVKGVNNGTGSVGIGVYGVHAGSGYGVYGNSNGGAGVMGNSTSGYGIAGTSTSGAGVWGQSESYNAGHFETGSSNTTDAVYALNSGTGQGIYAESLNNNAIQAVAWTAGFAGMQCFNWGGGIGVWTISFGDGGVPMIADLEGTSTPTGNNIALFQKDGVNQARIDATGKGFFNGGTQNSGADVAESFDVEGNRNEYEPGDVLVISQSSDRTVEKSQTPYSTLVAGVFATKPGVLLTEKTNQTQIDAMVPMGVVGVIPTKVCLEGGVIKRGDLIVTSSTPGVAMKADPDKVKIGQVIGKALEDYSSTGIGKIKVLVSIK